jgi:hypothetical protein
MLTSRRFAILAIGILILAQHPTTRAADVLQNVPHDALGFAVIKNLSATDMKVGKLLAKFNAQYPSPLVFLEAVTGIREGLESQGDFMLAMLPPNGGRDLVPQYCVWLPVTDYDRLLTLLEAAPGDPVSVIRIAGEDLLIARQGAWAVLMDPDQRPRMEQLLKDDKKLPAAVAAWKSWIEDNDVAVVMLHSGIEQVLDWSAHPPKSNDPDADESDDDLFGQLEEPDQDDAFVAAPVAEPLPNPLNDRLRREIHKWIVRAPKVKELVMHAEAIAAAGNLDEAGNASVSVRLKPSNERRFDLTSNPDTTLPPTLFEKGEFILHGAGHLPSSLMATFASAYCRRTLDDLKANDRIELDDELAAQFGESLVTAASDITAWSIAHQPGDLKTGVYNNSFLVLRVPSTRTFLEHAANAMDRWNTMHRESDNETKYVFDIEATTIGVREATQYLLDIGETGGIPALPEMRQLMEKFFGPGGKMRMWLVPVDEQIVLLGAGTPEQVAAALEALERREQIDWNGSAFVAANKLLAQTVDWRVFFSPRGYYDWKRREAEAMNNGMPVIGAKPAKDFPASPPIVLFGNTRDNELKVNAAVTAETIKAAGAYFK